VQRSNQIFKAIDWTTITVYFLLVLIGWINIYAAVYNDQHHSILDFSQRYGKQLIWISVSVALIIIVFLFDAKAFEFLAYPIYFFAILLLIAVLFTKPINNARSWFEIGTLRLQPSEFAKLATALVLARIMSVYDFKIDRLSSFLLVTGIIILPAGLILLENDTGSALVYSSFLIVFYREGFSPWYLLILFLFAGFFILSLVADLFIIFIILPAIALIVFYLLYHNLKWTLFGLFIFSLSAILLIVNNYYFHLNRELVLLIGIFISTVILVIFAYSKGLKFVIRIAAILVAAVIFIFSVDYLFDNILEKHQRTRIKVVLGMESDPLGVEYNVKQSKIAIGSGEFIGKGFLQGTQTKFKFVPEQDTDFIFCTVGEEWGFLGTSLVILLFGILLVRIVRIAERQRTRFNRVFGYSVASILFFHVTINIGMTIGLAPVIGIPLPFFSYGGSSLWSFTILLFVLLKLDSTRLDKF
jgi:rod shape determining protein RodA